MDQTPALDSTYDRQAVIWCCLRLNYPPSHSFGAALIGVIIASVLVEPLPSSCYVLIQTTSYRLYGGKQLSALSPLFPSHSCRPVSCSQVLYYFNNNKNRDPFHNSLVCLCALPSVSQILTPDRLLQHGCLIRSTRRSSLTQVRFLSMSPISEITSIWRFTPSVLLPHQGLFQAPAVGKIDLVIFGFNCGFCRWPAVEITGVFW